MDDFLRFGLLPKHIGHGQASAKVGWRAKDTEARNRGEETGMAEQGWQSLPAMFFEQAAKFAAKPYLWSKRAGRWESSSYGETAAQVRRIASGLLSLGVAPGDRVALISENRPEWTIADLAIMAVGAITVPSFTTNTMADHRHVLTHSGAKGLILSTKALAERVLPAALEAPDLAFIVAMEDLALGQRLAKPLRTWAELSAMGDDASSDIQAQVAGLRRSDVCCFIYSSGTGGVPKGIMLTHGSI